MKGSRYVDGVLVTQDTLSFTEEAMEEGTKERLGSLTDYGIINDIANPFALTNNANTTLTITSGEAYCQFDKTNTSPGYGNTGERIFLSNTLSSHAIKNSPVITGDPRHIFLVYVEIHNERRTDQSNTQHYTKKLDSFVIVQLSDAELSTFSSGGSVYINDNPIHSDQTDLTGLSDEERDDTFGTDGWKLISGDLVADVTITNYNSIYIGTLQFDGTAVSSYSTFTRPTLYIKTAIIDLATIESQLSNVGRHTNGIIGSSSSLSSVIDSITFAEDTIVITDLGADDYVKIGVRRLSSGGLVASYRNVGLSSFSSTGAYFIYVYYDTSDGVFKTTHLSAISNEDNYFLLCRVYVDTSLNTIKAYLADKRYDASATSNPVDDLRVFGTTGTKDLSDALSFSDSLVMNGNFEEGGDGEAPFGWAGGGVLDVDALGGKYSLKIATGSIAISDPLPYDKLKSYTASLVAKADAASTDLFVSLRGYVGKDYLDAAVTDDATTPINVSYTQVVSGDTIPNGTWTEIASGFDRSVSDWTGTTPLATSYSFPTDIALIKYFRVVFRVTGTGNIFIDNTKFHETIKAETLGGIPSGDYLLKSENINTETFTASGTFTVPAGVTSVVLTGIGAGGGASSGGEAINSSSGGGGGGAGAAINDFPVTGLTPGASITVGVGSGGAGAAGSTIEQGNDGGDGVATSFGGYLTLPGGNGGVGAVDSATGGVAGSSGGIGSGDGGDGGDMGVVGTAGGDAFVYGAGGVAGVTAGALGGSGGGGGGSAYGAGGAGGSMGSGGEGEDGQGFGAGGGGGGGWKAAGTLDSGDGGGGLLIVKW